MNIEKQLELEEEAMGLGVKRYREALLPWNDKEKKGSALTELPPGAIQLQRTIVPVSDAIGNFKDMVLQGMAGSYASVVDFIKDIDNDELAFVTCKQCINAIHENGTVQKLSQSIAQLIIDERNFAKFKDTHPNYAFVIGESIKKSTSQRRSAAIVRDAMHKADLDIINLSLEERTKLGAALINIFIKTTGLIRLELQRKSKNKTVNIVTGTEEIMKWLEDAHSRCELLSPVYLPMVVTPLAWTNPTDGGYLNQQLFPLRIIKTHNLNYLEELSNWDMPLVYSALNALQETPWRINKRLFQVMRSIWDGNGTLGNMPDREDLLLPTKPWDIAENDEARKEWSRKAAAIHSTNNRMRGKRIAMSQKLWIAEKFKDEEAIYFPHVMDWRGRIYPVPNLVNPQSDDFGKSLLQFAEGKPLGSTGARWIAIHIANLFGVDKVSFDERVKWVEEHSLEICMSALNPEEYTFWTTADKPYQALAACFEWEGYKTEGEAFISHLPIAQDGSNNGVQHFAMVMRDVRSAEAVNLLPNETPQDIYQKVADVVSAKIEMNAADGEEMALEWLGKIDRKLCKRPVMTLPYGATKYGMVDQVLEEVRKSEEKGKDYGLSDQAKACRYIAGVIYDSIGEVVSSARLAMDWLQEVARTIAKDELPVRWITPVGFPVLQEYRHFKFKEIKLTVGNSRVRMKVGDNSDKLNKKRQASGISPNVVHSWDASHLVATVNLCLESGLQDFAMVHDSYAVHACDVDTMNRHIREAFVMQYTDDRLEDFRRQVIEQLPGELGDNIPPVPPKGDLEASAVYESKYFFA